MPLKLRKLSERSEGTTESKSAIRSKMSEATRTSKAIKGTRRSDGAKETETRKGAKEAEEVKQGGKISFAAISNRWECMKVHFNSVDFFQFQFWKKFHIKNRN
jgi:hypothetical protein